MTTKAKAAKVKMTKAQKQAIKDFESHWGFEFMKKDEVMSGDCTFDFAWDRNIEWLDDHLTETRFFYSKYHDPERQQEDL